MEPVGSAAVVLLCAEEDDLELVRWVHAARAQGLSPEVVTGIERDDAPLLESMRLTTDALFVVLRSDNLGADRMRQIKSCFASHRRPAQKLVALRLDGTAEAAIERIAQQIAGGLRSRSESSLLLAIEDVAPQIDRVLVVPHATGRRPSSSASLPVVRASSSASLPVVRASSSASLPVVRASSSAAAERVGDDAQPGGSASSSATHPAIVASRAARAAQDRRARAGEPRTTVYTTVSARREKPPVPPLPALANIPATPPPAEEIPTLTRVNGPTAPDLDEVLAAARAHERASTGNYALDDETLPMGRVEIADAPPRPRARPRPMTRAAIAAAIAAVATGSVGYVLVEGRAAGPSTAVPADVHEPAAAPTGRVSIPVPTPPSTPNPPPAARAPEPASPTPAAAAAPQVAPTPTPPAPADDAATLPPRERRARARPRPLEELPPPPRADATAAAPAAEPVGENPVEPPPPEPAPLEAPATPGLVP